MQLKINLNWCCGGARRGAGSGDVERLENGGRAENIEGASSNPHIKRLEELDNYYQVDWTRNGFLGQGHFAQVYRGVDIRTGMKVAVKRISRKNQDVKTLRQEIEALLKVNGHPNIVKLYDVFIDTELVILIMELLEGGELFSRVVNSGAYSERDASRHFRKITEALAYMHQHNVIHRDLKPENLILATPDPDSDIKVSDFGLSKVIGEDNNGAAPLMTTICGTSAYAAPEIGKQTYYSSKVDTWSLGVILFVVLAAYHPFDPYGTKDDMGLRVAVCNYQWDFDDAVWNNMSEDVKDLIRHLLCSEDKRLDAQGILNHPWIKKYQQLPQRPLTDFSTRSLRQFVSSTAFGGLGDVMIPEPFDEENDEMAQGNIDMQANVDMQIDPDDIQPLPFDPLQPPMPSANHQHHHQQQLAMQ